MTASIAMPPALRAKFRIADILRHARRYVPGDGTPADRYLAANGLRPDRLRLEPGALWTHPLLSHWAQDRGGSWPALIGLATSSVMPSPRQERALHVTFLRPDGGLAPVSLPRLVVGPAKGVVVRLAEPPLGDGSGFLTIVERIETGLRLLRSGRLRGGLVAVLKASALGAVPLDPRLTQVFVVQDDNAATAEGAAKRAGGLAALRARGVPVFAQRIAEACDA